MDPNRLSMPFREMSSRLSLVFMVTLAIALLLLGRAETYVFDQARQFVTDLAAPLLELASRPVAVVRHVIERTDKYAYVFDENEKLREENARLLHWRDVALKLESKVARYEALLNVQIDPQITYVSGRVVSDNGGPFVETVILNVGSDKGVKSGQAVVDTDGLVGRVVATGAKASRILLLTDLNSRIPVVIEPAHYKAILAGDNTDWPRIDYLRVTGGVSQGDRVVTSGDGGLIPPGIPVGLVIQTSDGFFRVESFADRDRLDYVRVLQFDFPNQIKRQDPPEALLGPPIKTEPVAVTVVELPTGAKKKKPIPPPNENTAAPATHPAPKPTPERTIVHTPAAAPASASTPMPSVAPVAVPAPLPAASAAPAAPSPAPVASAPATPFVPAPSASPAPSTNFVPAPKAYVPAIKPAAPVMVSPVPEDGTPPNNGGVE